MFPVDDARVMVEIHNAAPETVSLTFVPRSGGGDYIATVPPGSMLLMEGTANPVFREMIVLEDYEVRLGATSTVLFDPKHARARGWRPASGRPLRITLRWDGAAIDARPIPEGTKRTIRWDGESTASGEQPYRAGGSDEQ